MYDIIAELCKISKARKEFRLGNRVWFNNYTNALDKDNKVDVNLLSTFRFSKLNQFYIYRMNSNRNTLLIIVEYKFFYKLFIVNL